MANQEQLEILKSRAISWNKWRSANDKLEIDLSGANLSGTNLIAANLSGANLFDANLSGAYLIAANLIAANLTNANLGSTDLSDAHLFDANLSGANLIAANLTNANLSKANLSNAKLVQANLTKSKLFQTDFHDAFLGGTIFGLTALRDCIDLETISVADECVIDLKTLQASKNIPKDFLLKIGLPELYIDYLPEFPNEKVIRLFSVFLSHSWANKEFAKKLYDALIHRGVQVWFDEKNLKPGDDIYDGISIGISVYDKMILVCSEEALNSWWVDEEVNRIFAKERRYSKEKGKKTNLLIPITIDDHVYQWDGPKAEDVRRFNIGDFRDWQDEEKFKKALDKLVAALNVDRGDVSPPTFLA